MISRGSTLGVPRLVSVGSITPYIGAPEVLDEETGQVVPMHSSFNIILSAEHKKIQRQANYLL